MRIRDAYAETDIPFGNGNVAKVGTKQHSMLMHVMTEELEEEQEEIQDGYIAQLHTCLTGLLGLAENDFVEAFVITKSDTDESGYSIQSIDDANRITVVKYRRNTTQE